MRVCITHTLLAVVVFCAVLAIILINQDTSLTCGLREERPGGTSGALAALDFWTRSRAYPDKDIPESKYFKAFQTEKARKKDNFRTINASGSWLAIGPTNLQGRALSVALNPQNPATMYVGTASGGLWRSYTGGTGGDWQQLWLGYPALGVSAIAIDPNDTTRMYVGTGEVYRYQNSTGGLVTRTTRGSYGVGILKTTDGGITWTKSLDWSFNQQTGIQALKLNPLNPRTIWAATSEGPYKSIDAGVTWNSMIPFPMAEDIVIHPLDTNRVMCSIGNFSASVVILTSDGGDTWDASPIPSYTGKTLLEIYAAHPNVVYASAADSTTGEGALWRSTDFGASWVKLSDNTNHNVYQVQGWYSHFVAVHPADSNQVVHAGVPVFKSTDGGRTFAGSSGIYADNHGYAHHPTDPNVLYVVDDDGVYRTDDFGATFTNVGIGMQSGQLYNGFSSSATDSLLALGQSQDHIPGYIYQGSPDWGISAVDEVGWTAINQSNDNVMYAGSRFGGAIYKSVNRGGTFIYSGSFIQGSWNSPFVISRSNPDILYFGTYKIYKTTNASLSWSVTNGNNMPDGNPALSMAVAATNPDTAFVGMAPINSNAHIFRTTNGGISWTDVSGILPNRYPMDLAVDPQDSRTVLTAYGGFGTGHIFKSADAGTSWTDITGSLPDIPTTAVAIDPLHSNILYVGNDFGVYVSSDGGSNWSNFSGGLPDAVIVADLVVSPSNRAIRVATHGNGVYERKMLFEVPSNYFDYRAYALNSPSLGGIYQLGSSITLKASFRNISDQARVDSFSVKYRILRGTEEVYSTTKRIAGLASGEVKQVIFDGSFIPTDTAIYALQAIALAGDSNPGNDTLTGSIAIVSRPDVSNFLVSKIYSPYAEISGGSPGPFGADNQLRAALPFPFRYDGYTYDSIQISTDGWLEFGTGSAGSLRGLSTEAQIGTAGAGEKSRMSATEHPTKALGPWWDRLTTDYSGTTGEVSYTTFGSSPDRLFIIQWKNMRAYNDAAATTARINFQVRLYESTNLIDYCYGQVASGSFGGPNAGATIALKDFVGGDYRYFDIAGGGVGLAGELRKDLNPLTDWPGADSCYHINTNPDGVSAVLAGGWNMVSVPMIRINYSVRSIFPGASGGLTYAYSGSYKAVDTLRVGQGYWAKFQSPGTQLISGSAVPAITVTLEKGWNMIGSVGHPVSVPTGGIISGAFFEYSTGYSPATMILPGKGYWVNAKEAGSIELGPAAASRAISDDFKAFSKIVITDRNGGAQTLYFTKESGMISPEIYEMPPLPPEGIFDARFAGGRMIETYPPQNAGSLQYPVKLQSPAYPLIISYSLNEVSGNGFTLEEKRQGRTIAVHPMKDEGKIIIGAGDENTLALKIAAGVPSVFALGQNYPNPFNPSTSISFDIPVKCPISLKVYDILGREVMTVAEGEFEAGSYTLRADFSNEASGLYLYRLKAGSFTDVKKLLVTK